MLVTEGSYLIAIARSYVYLLLAIYFHFSNISEKKKGGGEDGSIFRPFEPDQSDYKDVRLLKFIKMSSFKY